MTWILGKIIVVALSFVRRNTKTNFALSKSFWGVSGNFFQKVPRAINQNLKFVYFIISYSKMFVKGGMGTAFVEKPSRTFEIFQKRSWFFPEDVVKCFRSPEWWNWQTCGTQNPVVAIPCGFDPRFRHQKGTCFRAVLKWTALQKYGISRERYAVFLCLWTQRPCFFKKWLSVPAFLRMCFIKFPEKYLQFIKSVLYYTCDANWITQHYHS